MTTSTKILLALLALTLAANAVVTWDRQRTAGENGVLREQVRVADSARVADSVRFEAVSRRALALADSNSRLAREVARARESARRSGATLLAASEAAVNAARDSAVSDSTLRAIIAHQDAGLRAHLADDARADSLTAQRIAALEQAVRDTEASGRAAVLSANLAAARKLAALESRIPTRRQRFVATVRTVGVTLAVDRLVALATP